MEYLIKSSALFLLMYLGYIIFLKKETFFSHNRWFLLMGILTSALLPFIEIPNYIVVEQAASQIPIQFEYIPTEVIIEDTPFDWSQLVMYIYCIGVAIFLFQFLFQFGSLILLLFKNTKHREGIYTYVIVKNRISPFSFFKWIVYNPSLFSDKELQVIINHEKVHVRQWHSIDIILSRLACVVFWFNPVCWLYHKSIQQNLEYIADDITQRHSSSEKDYQQLLVKTSVGNTNIHLTSNFYNSLIKKRIVMLQKERSNFINRWKSALVIPFFILFLMSFNTKDVFIEQHIINDQQTSIQTSSIEIYFTPETTDESFEKIKKNLKKQGVTMTVKKKKRNTEGLLTDIKVVFETKNSTTSYAVNDDEGIEPFYFRKKGDGSMSVSSAKIIEVVEEPEVIEEQEVIEIIEEEPQIIEEIIEVIEEKEDSINSKTRTFVIRQNGNTTKITGDTIHIIESNPNVKGKYIFRTRDSIATGKPNAAYTFKSSGNVKVSSNSFTIKTDSIKPKKTITYRNSSANDPIFVINGKVVTKAEFKGIDPQNIDKVNVLKDKKAITKYGKKGKDGVVEIYMKDKKGPWKIETNKVEFYPIDTKDKADKSNKKNPWKIETRINSVEFYPTSTIEDAEAFIKSSDKPLIIIDNAVLGNVNTIGLNNDAIKAVSILKGDKAIKAYGDDGKNGVIIIHTKDYIRNLENLTSQNKKISKSNSNKYTTEISAIGFVDDNNPKEAMVLRFISKITPDSMIEKHINQLKSAGITAKISKLKRNKSGEIVKIKVSLKDENGNSSSAVFENSSGIPTINFGRQGDNLVVSSKKL